MYGTFIQYQLAEHHRSIITSLQEFLADLPLQFSSPPASICLEKREEAISDQSHLILSSLPLSSYPLLSSTSSAVTGCVLKRSPLLRPPPGPEGRYRLVRRRMPSYPGFMARSREDVVRPASEQLAGNKGEIKGHRTGKQADGGHARAGDRTLSRPAWRSPSAAGGHFSDDPLTLGCGAAEHRVQRGRQRSPPRSACWQSPGNPAWSGGGGDAGEDIYDLNRNPPCWENTFYTTFLLILTFQRHWECFEKLQPVFTILSVLSKKVIYAETFMQNTLMCQHKLNVDEWSTCSNRTSSFSTEERDRKKKKSLTDRR